MWIIAPLFRFWFLLAFLILGATASALGAEPKGAPQAPHLTVTFLGTGTPSLNPDRYGAAILVEAGEKRLLFDAGRGATIRLAQAGFAPVDVDAVFLTHFHSDHVSGLPDFFLTRILIDADREGKNIPLFLYGPPGTQALADGIVSAFSADLAIRRSDERLPTSRMRIEVMEKNEGVIYRSGPLSVTMFTVDHGEEIKPAVGYRIDYASKSIVISGDTRFDARIAQRGMGADLIIHETAIADARIAASPRFGRILAHHTAPEDVGRIFATARPGLAVLSHIGMHGDVDERDLVAAVRTRYDGPLLIATDLSKVDLSSGSPVILPASR